MKIKIKYELKDAEGINKKTYSKTFSQVNENATKENFEAFADAYLGLMDNKGQNIKYVITKTNEEEITVGNVL